MDKSFPREYTPCNKEEFWCSSCDTRVVDSTDKTTGKFFSVYGHNLGLHYRKTIGECQPTRVAIALCSECIADASVKLLNFGKQHSNKKHPTSKKE